MDLKNDWVFIKRDIPNEIADFITTTFDIYEIRGRVATVNGIEFIIHTNEQNHSIPHVHAKYGEYEISIAIDDASVLTGNIPKKQLKFACQWICSNKDRLLNEWSSITISATAYMTQSGLDFKDLFI